MRIHILCISLLTTAASLFANSSCGQSIYQEKIVLRPVGTSLRKAIANLEQNSGYTIFFPSEKINREASKHADSLSGTIAQVLDQLLSNTGLQYRQIGRNIVLSEKQMPTPAITGNVDAGQASNQPIPITGAVYDESGSPLAGVSVIIKDDPTQKMQKSTSTDQNGHFRLLVATKGSTLLFKMMGYESQEVRVDSLRQLKIILKTAVSELEGVVVTGLYDRPKEMYTGASRSFKQEDLQKVTGNNVLTALKALDPSFQIAENINLGSDPNALPQITVRGGNSLANPTETGNSAFNYQNNPNTPLFILDGFETSLTRINDLDMTRIKSIDLLKDATATSIYGSRAANGVVVIETIRPEPGKLRLTYTGNTSLEAPDLSGYDLLNATEKLDIEQKANVYSHSWNSTNQQLAYYYNARLAAVKSGVNTDWLAQPVRTGIGQKHNLYLEGGASDVLYGINATYYRNNGSMKGSDRTTMTGNTFLSYRVKNFQFRNDLTLTNNKGNNSPYGSFAQYARLNPYWTPYNEDGSLKVYLEEVYDVSGKRLTNFDHYNNLDGYVGRPTNPLYDASLGTVNQTSYNNLTNNFSIQWQTTNWLRINGSFAYQYQADESDVFLPAQHSSFAATPTFEKGSYTKGYGKMNSYEGIFTANLSKIMGKNTVFGTLGTNLRQDGYNTQRYIVEGFPNSSLDQLIQGRQFPEGSKPTGTESLSRLFGLFSNLSYSYDMRYLLDFSYRLDGSSQFGSEKRFAPFWSAGAGWNLQNEAFLKNNPAVTRLKLRYSYGYTGSQNFASYLGRSTSQYFTASDYRGIIGTYLLAFGNDALAWQKTRKSNIGFDLTLFKRLDITGNYYVENTEGSIASISTAPSTGFATYSDNMGDLRAKGWELYSKLTLLGNEQKRDNWSIFVNLFQVKNEIRKVSNTIKALNEAADETYSSLPITRYAEGQSTTAIWAVPSLGIDPSTGYEIYRTRDGILTNTYNPLDQVIVGDSRPSLEGTFGTNLEIKGIGLNAYFRFRYGGQAYNQTLVDRVESIDVGVYNVDHRVSEERWLIPGDHTFFKGLIDERGATINSATYATSRFVQDDNLLSLESLSIYYRFPDILNKRFKLSNTKITLYSNDVFRLSSIKQERGLDYPFSHTYSLQISTSF